MKCVVNVLAGNLRVRLVMSVLKTPGPFTYLSYLVNLFDDRNISLLSLKSAAGVATLCEIFFFEASLILVSFFMVSQT